MLMREIYENNLDLMNQPQDISSEPSEQSL